MDFDKIIINIFNGYYFDIELINKLNPEQQDICYHYLHKLIPIKQFYKENNEFTNFYTMFEYNIYLQYQSKKHINTNIIELIPDKYNYDCIIEIFKFYHGGSDNLKDFIKTYPCNKYITKNIKNIRYFLLYGSLLYQPTSIKTKFINKIIAHINNINIAYKSIISYYNENCKFKQSLINMGIPNNICNIVLENIYSLYIL